MNTLCCDGCIPETSGDSYVTWHVRKQPDTLARNRSVITLTSDKTIPKITSYGNRINRENSLSVLKIPVNRGVRTKTEGIEMQRSQMVIVKHGYMLNPELEKIREERVWTLQRENSQYLSLINNELIPLQRDYKMLKVQYQKNLQLVYRLDQKLKDLESIYYAPTKSILNSQITRI